MLTVYKHFNFCCFIALAYTNLDQLCVVFLSKTVLPNLSRSVGPAVAAAPAYSTASKCNAIQHSSVNIDRHPNTVHSVI